MRLGWLSLILAASLACTADGEGNADGGPGGNGDAGTDRLDAADGPGVDAAPGCAAVPAPGQPWVRSYQDDIVAKLSGARAFEPGQFLPNRATVANRASTRRYLASLFTELGLTAREQAYGGGANVYAQLDADAGGAQTLVIGAHFDSVPDSPGANDNATGVAMVMSLARYLSEVDCRTKNVVFVLFDEEEEGLVGSFQFAQFLASSSLDVIAVHTVDQNGWDDDGDRLVELERASTGLFAQYQTANAFGIPLQQTQTGATDHVSFRDFGFKAIGITEGFVSGDTTPHYHLPSDTYDTVSFAYLESTTVLAHATIAAQVRNAALEPSYVAPLVRPTFAPVAGCRGRH